MARTTYPGLTLNVLPEPASGGTSELQQLADSLSPGSWAVMPTPSWNASTFELYPAWVSRGYYDSVNNRLVAMTKEPNTGGDGTPEANLFIYDIDTNTWTNPYRGYPSSTGSILGHPWEGWGVRQDTGEVYYCNYGTYNFVKWTGGSTGAWTLANTLTGGPSSLYGMNIAWNPYFGTTANTSDPAWVGASRNTVWFIRPDQQGSIASQVVFAISPNTSSSDANYNNALYWPKNKSVIISRYAQVTHSVSEFTYPGATITVPAYQVFPLASGQTIPSWSRLPDMPSDKLGSGADSIGPKGKFIMSPSGNVPLALLDEKSSSPGRVYGLQEGAGVTAWVDYGVIAPFHRTDINPYGKRPYYITCPNEGVIVGLIIKDNVGDYDPAAINMVVWKPPTIIA